MDRGPETKQLIDYLIKQDRGFPNDVFLMGNHEDMFLANFEQLSSYQGQDREDMVRCFFMNGGRSTMQSYGMTDNHLDVELPVEHVRWVAQLRLYHEDKYRYYVHAGVDPTIPLVAQNRNDLLWIRNRFLYWPEMFEKYIVHGHTPKLGGIPDIRHNRTNMDTGGCFGGAFSIARFDDHQTKPTDVYQVPGFES